MPPDPLRKNELFSEEGRTDGRTSVFHHYRMERALRAIIYDLRDFGTVYFIQTPRGFKLITERFAHDAITLGFRMTLGLHQFRYRVFRTINIPKSENFRACGGLPLTYKADFTLQMSDACGKFCGF